MSLNLMTGYAGEPHITSADDGAVNAAIYGASKYVLNTGQKFAYELISNNLIKIKDGYAINQGRKIGQPIDDYEELTIDNGLQGVKRSDIIAIRYSKNPDTGIESAEFIVIKGTSGDDYKDPACQTGNIIQGDSVDDFPLYRVKIEGLTITAVEPMFDVLVSMEELQNKYNDILGSQDISKIGDGTVTGAISSINSNLDNQPIFLPYVIPSQSINDEIYFKEWIQYMYDKGLLKPYKILNGVVSPNTYGIVIGMCYPEPLRYCSFLYMPATSTTMIRFGYSDYSWFFTTIIS